MHASEGTARQRQANAPQRQTAGWPPQLAGNPAHPPGPPASQRGGQRPCRCQWSARQQQARPPGGAEPRGGAASAAMTAATDAAWSRRPAPPRARGTASPTRLCVWHSCPARSAPWGLARRPPAASSVPRLGWPADRPPTATVNCPTAQQAPSSIAKSTRHPQVGGPHGLRPQAPSVGCLGPIDGAALASRGDQPVISSRPHTYAAGLAQRAGLAATASRAISHCEPSSRRCERPVQVEHEGHDVEGHWAGAGRGRALPLPRLRRRDGREGRHELRADLRHTAAGAPARAAPPLQARRQGRAGGRAGTQHDD